jgi:hypothetical protein
MALARRPPSPGAKAAARRPPPGLPRRLLLLALLALHLRAVPRPLALGSPAGARNFVFGYGSLICRNSRLRTCDSPLAFPCRVAGLERGWWFSNPARAAYTALGCVRRRADERPDRHHVNGVLVPVNSLDELARWDAREWGYTRELVPLSSIRLLLSSSDPSSSSSSSPLSSHRRILRTAPLLPPYSDSEDPEDDSNVNVWVYTVPTRSLPTPTTPLVRSYLDVVLEGCLGISPSFAEEFLNTTVGWETGQWLRDERDPEARYVRRSFEQGTCERIQRARDELLRKSVPAVFA